MRSRHGQQNSVQSLVGISVGNGHAGGQGVELLLRLRERYAGLQAGDAEHVAVLAVAQHPRFDAVELGLHHVRNPEIEGFSGERSVKSGRGNAYDCELVLIDTDCLADDSRVSLKMRAPVAVADDSDGISAGLVAVFSGQEDAAQLRLCSQHSEEISRDQFAPNALGMILRTNAESGGAAHGNVNELQIVTEIDVVGIGIGDEFAARGGRFEGDQAVRVLDAGKRVQQDGVDPLEDSRVGPDADRERQNGYQCEARIASQHAQALQDFLAEGVHTCSPETYSLVHAELQTPACRALKAKRSGMRVRGGAFVPEQFCP